MEGIDALVGIVVGYVSVPLAAFAMRKGWPSQIRFLLAGVLALGIAFATVVLRGDAITTQAVLSAFGLIFASQQATFHLEVPGAGSPTVLSKLEEFV